MTKNLEIQNIIVEQVTNQFISNHEIDIEQDLGNDGYITQWETLVLGFLPISFLAGFLTVYHWSLEYPDTIEIVVVIFTFSDLHYITHHALEKMRLFKLYCPSVLQL